MKVRVNKKVKVRKTTLSRVRAEALAELNLLTKYMTSQQINDLLKRARHFLYT